MMPQERVPITEEGGIDWQAVRERLDRSRAALERAFSGEGVWAQELLRRREHDLAEVADKPESHRPLAPMLVAHGHSIRYGLALRHLGNILPLPRLARVPGAAPELLGLIAVGGRVMRLFDVDRLCGNGVWGAGAEPEGGYAVLLRGLARPVALYIRAVEAVQDFDLPRLGTRSEAGPYIQAITEDRIAVLDMAAIIDRVKGTEE
jgi:purine-binding chemotaxis protein CheW